MSIEIATTKDETSKIKGDLLEDLARRLLIALGYEVESQLRQTGVELDLLCKHKVNGKKVYVECKAYRDTVSATVLRQLLGTVVMKSYQEGWLISTGILGKDAKGLAEEWENKPLEVRAQLSIYTPERIEDSLIHAGIVKSKPTPNEVGLVLPNADIGDWTLLITAYGTHWIAPVLTGGIPKGVIVFDSKSGKVVDSQELLKGLAATDTSFAGLDFECAVIRRSNLIDPPTHLPQTSVVEVTHGDSWNDYRPARPEDFIGRSNHRASVFRLFDDVREHTTRTRIFAVTGDSGMGKSSLIAKIRDQSRNKRHKGKIFVFAVDMRAAQSSGYILASLLRGLSNAKDGGYGDSSLGPLQITDYGHPLASASIAAYLDSLATQGHVVCIIFDQFEELFAKTELFSVFEEAKRLFLSVVATSSNVVLGFAWRTDVTVPQDHPAYFLWHQLADHRFEVRVGPFSESETGSALTRFERDLEPKGLHPEIRRNIQESCQGYPWLLKKLCVHLNDQVKAGTEQGKLRETLDIATLFDQDLQKLSMPQQACLRHIAKSAPADWYGTLEAFEPHVLGALQGMRLIVRSGDRINVYWDIFKDYILNKQVPTIPFTYLPSSPSLDALLRVASHLNHVSPTQISSLALKETLSEKTVGNVIRDLRMFGVATTMDIGEPMLDKSVSSNERKVVLQRIRETLKRHALYLRLSRIESGSRVTGSEVADMLRQVNPRDVHRNETWGYHADRMGAWLTASGLLARHDSDDWIRIDTGKVELPGAVSRSRKHSIFAGGAPPHIVIDALEALCKPPSKSYRDMTSKGFRNAVNILSGFRIVALGRDRKYQVIRPISTSCADLVWQAAKKEGLLMTVVDLVAGNPSISGVDIGNHIVSTNSIIWSSASRLRIGNALRRWAEWLLEGSGSDTAPLAREGRVRKPTWDPLQNKLEFDDVDDEILRD